MFYYPGTAIHRRANISRILDPFPGWLVDAQRSGLRYKKRFYDHHEVGSPESVKHRDSFDRAVAYRHDCVYPQIGRQRTDVPGIGFNWKENANGDPVLYIIVNCRHNGKSVRQHYFNTEIHGLKPAMKMACNALWVFHKEIGIVSNASDLFAVMDSSMDHLIALE